MTEEAGPAAATAGNGVEFVRVDERTETMSLEHPIKVDGVEVHSLLLHKLTAAEVTKLADEWASTPDFDDFDLFAHITDQPPYVLRALDGDDWLALRERGLGFLPRRYRVAAGLIGETPGARSE